MKSYHRSAIMCFIVQYRRIRLLWCSLWKWMSASFVSYYFLSIHEGMSHFPQDDNIPSSLLDAMYPGVLN
ncbi:hypothetical protein BRADI_4g16413v3 [Brachypodium distachyon]|uniref:Uncharacterized protein n=1 Tax=Brachypodium distachyon TaxID=15368 RepID=A0A2K2CN74_BRADI|nr:hypothetical protein BRADI_4g16413v3 [Brachypodium distachyon]